MTPLAVSVDPRTGTRTVAIRCPWCRRTHLHGAGTIDQPSYGHRRAHCAPRWRRGVNLGRPAGAEAGYRIAEPEAVAA